MQQRAKFEIEDEKQSPFHETFETKKRTKFEKEVTKRSPFQEAVWIKKWIVEI